jgi:hypothetical protein
MGDRISIIDYHFNLIHYLLDRACLASGRWIFSRFDFFQLVAVVEGAEADP